jgi:shikimate kinase
MKNPIFLIGMPGAGKTTIGRKLSTALQMPFIDLDEYIEAKHGQSVRQIFADKGESFFRQAEAAALREVANHNEGAIVATGGGTPCFLNNMELMNEAGTTVFLKLTPEVIAERLMAHGREQRPLVAGKTPDEIRQFVTETLAKRLEFYQNAHITYQNPSRDISELCRMLRTLENMC